MKIKILIVEHDLHDVDLVKHELVKGGLDFTSEIARNEQEYRAALAVLKPDIILSDYSFPSFDGTAAFEIKQELTPDTPFIFVSGAVGEETSVGLVKNGVTDFVLKDKLFTLCSKVNRALKESHEQQLKKSTEWELVLSENRLCRAQRVAHMGSWEFDFEANNILWSDETFRIYGLPPGGRRQSFEAALGFIHPEDLARVLNKLELAQRSLCDFSVNFRIVRKNGIVRHLYLEAKLEFDPNGKPNAFHGIVQDVTGTVLLENKLVRERSARQREITEAVITAQEKERAYIGRELHENINQILAVVNIYIQLAGTRVKDRKMYLDKSYEMVGNAIREIRTISKALVTPAENFIGLFGSIRNLLYDLKLMHAIKVEFHGNGTLEKCLNEKLQLTIFRIVQEQINNILKHAEADLVTIRLTKQDNQVILIISDNGLGCDISNVGNGVGIINIKSRTEAYQGIVSVLSKPGEGYELKVILPLNRQNVPGKQILAF